MKSRPSSKLIRYSIGADLVLDGTKYVVEGYESSPGVKDAYIKLTGPDGKTISLSRWAVHYQLKEDRRKKETTK